MCKTISAFAWVGSAILLITAATQASAATAAINNDGYIESSQPGQGYGPSIGYTLMAPGDYRLYQFLPPVVPVGQVTPFWVAL